MDLLYFRKRASVIIRFKQNEIKDARTLLRALLENEIESCGCGPDFGQELYKNLVTTEEKAYIEFGFIYFDIAVRFLEVVIDVTTKAHGDTDLLEKSLAQIKEWNSRTSTLQ